MDLPKLLKELKNIGPDTRYTARSRDLFLRAAYGINIAPLKKPGFGESFRTFLVTKPILAAEMLVVLALLAGGSFYFREQSSERLVVEADDVNTSIQVKLDEIKYLLNKPAPLNPEEANQVAAFLNQAESALKEANESIDKDNMEDSLLKMKEAEEAFSKIESIASQAQN